MITKLPKEFLSVISHNNGLKVYLSNLTKGREMTPRSWLYENKEPDQILSDWMEILSKLKDGDSYEQNVFQFDTSQLKKWGPQGGIKPIQDLMEEIVMPTFSMAASPQPKAFKEPRWSIAQGRVLPQIRALRPAMYTSVVADMRARDTLESNSGWPDFSRRNKPDVLNAALLAAHDEEWIDYPAIALFRNYNQKTRLVWMFPESTNIVEGSFCQPVQSAIINRHLSFYTPWEGFDLVRDQITDAYGSGKYIAASDFASTDSHFTLNSTYQVFDVLKRVFQSKFAGRLRLSLERMHKIPLIVGLDEMITGNHGVASGSNWTNFIETVFDEILAEYVCIETQTQHKGLCAIGDDMAWVSDKFDDAFASTLEQYGEQVGQLINAEKVTNEPDRVKFLQRLFQRGYSRSDGKLRGVYSTIRALKSSVYPERFHKPETWSEDMFCARQFMILENCVDHPLFEDFVKFVVHGQRGLIPFARKGETELNKITRKTKLIPGFNPTYNQEKRDTSLASFESVKLARRM